MLGDHSFVMPRRRDSGPLSKRSRPAFWVGCIQIWGKWWVGLLPISVKQLN
jgi:hypothetical protein